MKTITKIEANRSAAVHRKCRVAAYCRVSTEHDDQIESLETQKAHYESWIKLHTEWESAGIFYDAGITGTKAEIRPGLQDLLQACRMGRVDRILVKSISRFSRNTAECLALVRELSGIIPDGRHQLHMERQVVRVREWFERLERFENYRMAAITGAIQRGAGKQWRRK